MSVAPDRIRTFPNAVTLHLFSYLTKSDLGMCSQISSEVRTLASTDVLWARIAERIFGVRVSVKNIKEFLRECASQKLKSNQEIVDRIQTFANRVSLGQNARFTCFIGTGPKYQTISIIIKGSKDKVTDEGQERSYDLGLTVSDFDLRDDCTAHSIVDGALPLAHPPQNPVTFKRQLLTSHGSNNISLLGSERLYAVMGFPQSMGFRSPMENRIMDILQKKLDQFELQAQRKNTLYATAVGLALLGVYHLNSYLTATSSDKPV